MSVTLSATGSVPSVTLTSSEGGASITISIAPVCVLTPAQFSAIFATLPVQVSGGPVPVATGLPYINDSGYLVIAQ
jgi:hypothetical protein